MCTILNWMKTIKKNKMKKLILLLIFGLFFFACERIPYHELRDINYNLVIQVDTIKLQDMNIQWCEK